MTSKCSRSHPACISSMPRHRGENQHQAWTRPPMALAVRRSGHEKDAALKPLARSLLVLELAQVPFEIKRYFCFRTGCDSDGTLQVDGRGLSPAKQWRLPTGRSGSESESSWLAIFQTAQRRQGVSFGQVPAAACGPDLPSTNGRRRTRNASSIQPYARSTSPHRRRTDGRFHRGLVEDALAIAKHLL